MAIFTENYGKVVTRLLDFNYCLECKEIPLDVKIAIGAQLALESGWGKSKLAVEHNNYGGLKWRWELAKVLEGIAEPVDYVDWLEAKDNIPEDKRDLEIHIYDWSDFLRVYFLFLSRKRYEGISKSFTSAEDYLGFLCDKGYVADMPNVPNNKEAIKEAYLTKIFDIMNRPYYRELCEKALEI